MSINPHNLVRHELIGLPVKITDSADRTLIGIKGIVIDETYNTLRIEVNKKEKVIPKAISTFVFKIPSGEKVQVDGKLLVNRPEDRIKKKFPRW